MNYEHILRKARSMAFRYEDGSAKDIQIQRIIAKCKQRLGYDRPCEDHGASRPAICPNVATD
jgi:hypothetical protein